MQILSILDTTLPLANPVLKFLVILLIILFTPIILNKLKIPHILGLIIAGAIIGPNGVNLLLRDSSIILSGTAGLLYIMFLTGLEIDINEFKRNSKKSFVFGLYTFIVPMTLGIIAGLYLLNFSVLTAVLLASMFASHTLIAYPIISTHGVTKNRAVNITVGGTVITDTLALLVLAVIVEMTSGVINLNFWVRLSISITAFSAIIIFIFPIIGRWFFKRFDDSVSQYIFVLSMVFLGAFLAEETGIEGIIGAFLAGLALNRLIPRTSPLKNRIEFVGNAIFIPFFLIGVGMLVDYRAFFQDLETIKVATVMTLVATLAKFLASWITQKSFNFSRDERRLIFGLSNAQAAATLAAVLVGHGIILGQSPEGEPIRLLNDAVLNGTIIMILVTCTIATFTAQKGAQNIALLDTVPMEGKPVEIDEKILIPLKNPATIEELIGLSMILKSKENKAALYAMNIVSNHAHGMEFDKVAEKILDKAEITASAADVYIHKILKYDLNIMNGINGAIDELGITDLVLGLHEKEGISKSFLGDITEGILSRSNITTFVYKPVQPIATIKRQIITVPKNAEYEIGFPFWLFKVWNIAINTGARLIFYGTQQTNRIIQDIHSNYPIEADFIEFDDWNDFLILSREIKPDDNLLIVLSRENKPSFHSSMYNIPTYLNKYFQHNSFILIYPKQIGVAENEKIDFNNPSLLEPIEKLDEIRRTIVQLFKRK